MRSVFFYRLLFLTAILGELFSCTPQTPSVQLGKMTLMPLEWTGEDFENRLEDTEVFNILNYLYYYNGGGVAVGDINNDSLPDLFFTANLDANRLYLNQGNGRFQEKLKAMMGHTSRFSMGSDLADINGDGRPDLITLDMKPWREEVLKTAESPEPYDVFEFKRSFGYYYLYPHNALQLNLGPDNEGESRFSEIAQLMGVDATDWSWSALFYDLDNDGAKDLYITNGIYLRPNDMDYIKFISQPEIARKLNGQPSREELVFIEEMPSVRLPNQVFHQADDYRMESKVADWGMDQTLHISYRDTAMATLPGLAPPRGDKAANPRFIPLTQAIYLEYEHSENKDITRGGFNDFSREALVPKPKRRTLAGFWILNQRSHEK